MNTKRNYLLLTPGPLSTSETVREAMLQDWCTWDKDYNEGIVTPIKACVSSSTKKALKRMLFSLQCFLLI